MDFDITLFLCRIIEMIAVSLLNEGEVDVIGIIDDDGDDDDPLILGL